MARGGIVNLIKNENLTSDYILANNNLLFDQQHIWHPYTSAIDPLACYEVIKAEGWRGIYSPRFRWKIGGWSLILVDGYTWL